MDFKNMVDYVEENKEQHLVEILERNEVECSECKGEGFFSNTEGTDFTPCEQCLGDGAIV